MGLAWSTRIPGKNNIGHYHIKGDEQLYLGVVPIEEDGSGGVPGPSSDGRSNESIKKIVSSSFSVQLVAVTSFYKLLDTFSGHRANTEQVEPAIVRKSFNGKNKNVMKSICIACLSYL